LSTPSLLVAGLTAAVSIGWSQGKLSVSNRAQLSEGVEFEIFLPLQHADELDQLLEQQHTPGSANYHKWLTPDQFRARFGPTQEQIATITETLGYYGLNVTAANSHGVHVQGTVNEVQRAFGATMWNALSANGNSKIVAAERLQLPAVLQNMGAQIVHFSPVARIRPHARRGPELSPDNRYGPYGGYWFDDLKQAYDFPSYLALTGAGRTIAIMSVSDYQNSDVSSYFNHEKLKTPQIIRHPISGGSPFDPNSGDSFECELDLEQAGGMAPGATLVLVNLPDGSDDSFMAGYTEIVEHNLADIVSTSFGGAELTYIAAYNDGVDYTYVLRMYNDIFRHGNAEGITFVASSGDSGGLGLPPVEYFTTPPQNPPIQTGNFLPGVEFFASSPYVTGVGGTNLTTTYNPPTLESKYVSENAFPDPEVPYDPYGVGNLVGGGVWGSGGGQSGLFAKPAYQYFINTRANTRAVPDISLQMGGCPLGLSDPTTCNSTDSSAVLGFAGAYYGVIGTSVSAPGFAGILALKEQYLGGKRLGNVNYEIYAAAALEPIVSGSPLSLFHQGQTGNNGPYQTNHHGYNMVLGVGTPLVRNFILAPQLPAAGNPRTPSNP
jgi:subtilase family serine protease